MSNKRDTKPKPCGFCKERFPAEGFERVLPVLYRCNGVLGDMVLLCLKCRRNEFTINKEPYPPKVDAYLDSEHGGVIVPQITENEATLHYCLKGDQLEPLPYVIARSVRTARHICQIKMYEERTILKRARRLYGGDIGVFNAREVLAKQGEKVEVPPEGLFRERRNRIRQAFLEKKIYATSKLTSVRDYVKTGRGDLKKIVDTYAV
ncbi:hypothetical protein BG015_008961 [Linnemannia schmuckeri]|uniref:Uncharacterized protein n=1 Tax=Linnemannia schmuckeri TaxID=64567 RepID=A0A9P5RYC0_9FUNG|nr:hypothetical protein BG015_008961 [Linnemannia schmuckeri]